jgi:hypothetical protein
MPWQFGVVCAVTDGSKLLSHAANRAPFGGVKGAGPLAGASVS